MNYSALEVATVGQIDPQGTPHIQREKTNSKYFLRKGEKIAGKIKINERNETDDVHQPTNTFGLTIVYRVEKRIA